MVTNDLVRWKEGRMLWDSIRVPQLQPGFTFTILFMFSTNKCSHAEASHNRSYSPFNWIEWIYSIVRSHHPETPVPSHTTYSTTVMMFKCHIISTATVWSKMLIIRSLISLILIWYGQWSPSCWLSYDHWSGVVLYSGRHQPAFGDFSRKGKLWIKN